MALRCLLFASDEGTAKLICQVLAGLGVEGESCFEAVVAVERVTNQTFQIVIIDWDQQPEAGLLLTTARDRKAAERPLTLAIVSDDGSVPKALQAGANSILRKPILVNQIRDTLTTARDLLRAKQESAGTAAQAVAASAGSAATFPASLEQEKPLRAGEFLQSAPPAPGGQFVTEPDTQRSPEQPESAPVDALKDLEPVAASVAQEKPAVPEPPPRPSEPKGLQWYLKGIAKPLPPIEKHAPAPAATGNPELLGFDQMPSPSPPPPPARSDSVARPTRPPDQDSVDEQKTEEALFAYMAGEGGESEEPQSRSRLGKRAIMAALVLAGGAILAAPQAPWHQGVRELWTHGRQVMHGWLNPQPVTPPQAPATHEDFGRAGDEYKLPVAENIPDATTDPSQIQVVPVIDPTVKKPNPEGANAVVVPGQGDGPTANPVDQGPTSGAQIPGNQPPAPVTPGTAQPVAEPAAGGAAASSAAAAAASAAAGQPHANTPAVTPAVLFPSASSVSSVPAQPAPPKNQPPHYASAPANVPSSLKSQMVSMTPDSSGNKPVETAMPSIEPVAVAEATERALLTEQPAIAYPANAKGQHGTVVLQVLIGRDGTVQDAKFLQGSLAFARTAIDGVKQWKFKPYVMNGRAVSVQTTFTMSFKPSP